MENSIIVEERKQKKTIKIDRSIAIEMFNEGKSYSEIARTFNCTAWAVQKLLKNKKKDYEKPINIELLKKINYEKLLKNIKFFVKNYKSVLSFDIVLGNIYILDKKYNKKIFEDKFPERKAIDFALAFSYYQIKIIENNQNIENYV
jgi:hypothetical protein